ncbi:MAG TPA: hypothetical protein VGS07_05495 [Thermoanaerobaculia bacterium]|jgi:hypothetical protein|nr:hypothetical protein [Thermoanaerobaculia bacterium]
MRLRYLLVLLTIALASPQVARAAFPVAESTALPVSISAFDRAPGVALDGLGNSVVVWNRLSPGSQVVARRFDPQGHTLGRLLVVTANGSLPTAAMNSHGDFAVAWFDAGSPKPSRGYPMHVQLFSPGGAKVGPTTLLNTSVGEQTTAPRIGVDQDGGFAVTWSSVKGVYVRRFDSKGVPRGNDVLTVPGGYYSSLAMRPDGGFTLVWQASQLMGRRFGTDGEADGEDFQINQQAASGMRTSTAATTADGGFVVAWDVCGTAPRGASKPPRGVAVCGIRARRFDAGARPLTDEFAVSPADGRSNQGPVVAAEDGHGYFAVTWNSCLQVNNCQIATQLYSPQSAPAPHVATAAIGSGSASPAIAVGPDGFVVAFSSSVCNSFFPSCRQSAPKGIYTWRFDF